MAWIIPSRIVLNSGLWWVPLIFSIYIGNVTIQTIERHRAFWMKLSMLKMSCYVVNVDLYKLSWPQYLSEQLKLTDQLCHTLMYLLHKLSCSRKWKRKIKLKLFKSLVKFLIKVHNYLVRLCRCLSH